MSRFVQEATASGVSADVLGNGTTIFCGTAEKMYNMPGAYTPIWVCCNWTTPISSQVDIPVNFSCYDEVKFIAQTGFNCNNACGGVMVLPSNSCVDAQLCPTCYCINSMWTAHTMESSSMNVNQQGCVCTGAFTCWNKLGYVEVIMHQGRMTHACEENCKNAMITLDYRARSATSFEKIRRYMLQPSCRCYYPACWPLAAKSYSSLNDDDLCKIVVRGGNPSEVCFTPLICGTCEVDGAFFGVWGIPKSNPTNTALSSCYQSA